MPPVPTNPRVKLRAATRRVPRARVTATEAEVEVDSEPNMRLSRAVVVMFLLHVVAIAGILAFSLIKQGKDAPAKDGAAASALEAEDSHVPTTKPLPRPQQSGDVGRTLVHIVQPGETLVRIANDNGVTVEALIAANGVGTATSSLRPGQELKLPDVSPQPNSVPPERLAAFNDQSGSLPPARPADASAAKPKPAQADTGKTYVVGKGESPYMIARKLKVNYDQLLKLNRIDDPKKLQPGQKLKIPTVNKPKSKQD